MIINIERTPTSSGHFASGRKNPVPTRFQPMDITGYFSLQRLYAVDSGIGHKRVGNAFTLRTPLRSFPPKRLNFTAMGIKKI